MAKTPKKVTPRLTKDVREAIRDMSKAPFGKPKKPSDFPKLTVAEAEEIKTSQGKKQPLYIKREGQKLTAKQLDNIAARISKERGISYNQAKEMLWKELSKAPLAKDVKQPGVTLSKKIPTREQLESTGYRAVKYQGKTVYLSPAQVKQVAKDLGVPIGFKDAKTNLFDEPTKSSYEKITNISPEARAIRDRAAAAEAERLRSEAMKSWEAQAKAAQTDPRVRPPAEGLNKPSPASPQAEAYANRLYQKAYKQLSPNERKTIKIIVEEEARRAAKVTSSKVGQNVKRPLPPIGGGAVGGLLGIGSIVGAVSTYKQAMQQAVLEKKRLESERMN